MKKDGIPDDQIQKADQYIDKAYWDTFYQLQSNQGYLRKSVEYELGKTYRRIGGEVKSKDEYCPFNKPSA